ncbi:hypothetical protein ACH5RR_008509 [Cinchona calisaya]|uniref:Uncharacterized protein n=1 Tax=Cinchona calisaya TaxID=153742 RepID=A0ABD3AFD6_9GENT
MKCSKVLNLSCSLEICVAYFHALSRNCPTNLYPTNHFRTSFSLKIYLQHHLCLHELLHGCGSKAFKFFQESNLFYLVVCRLFSLPNAFLSYQALIYDLKHLYIIRNDELQRGFGLFMNNWLY